MNTTDNDNTLQIMTVLLSVMFFLIALKSAHADSGGVAYNEDSVSFWLNVAWIFAFYEMPFLLSVYVAGPMISDAMPMFLITGKKVVVAVKRNIRSKIKNEKHMGSNAFSENSIKQREKSSNMDKRQSITDLPKEIMNYTTETFSNLLSDEQIGKLLDNFKKLNTCGPFEVVEKQNLQGVFEFDLIHFAWNVCKRIHRPDICPKIFGFATAELIKASFPLTLDKYAVGTIKSRLKDSDPTTKFRLKIIETGQPLVPHIFSDTEDIK